MRIYEQKLQRLFLYKDVLSARLSLKTALRDSLHVNFDPGGCKLRRAGGNRQGSHSLPCHAHFCSIIATCSQWWDRSSPRQSWSSAMVDISRLLVDLSSSGSPPSLLKIHALAHFGDFLSVAAGRGLQLDTLVWVHQGSSSSPLHCSVLFLTILNSLQIHTILSVAFTQKHLPISSHPSKRMSRRISRKHVTHHKNLQLSHFSPRDRARQFRAGRMCWWPFLLPVSDCIHMFLSPASLNAL